jgi:sulfonate transport system substrate-binding protein
MARPPPSRRRIGLGTVVASSLPEVAPRRHGRADPRRGAARAADLPAQVTLDWAYYNPVSLVLKDQGLVEEELKPLGVGVRWVQSLGSNKALEFLNAGSIDLGSTAGAAALLGRINGNPIRAVYVYSKPEWTALVARPDSGVAKVEDLKGSGSPSRRAPTPTSSCSARWTGPASRSATSSSSCSSTTRARRRWSAATSTPGPGSTR